MAVTLDYQAKNPKSEKPVPTVLQRRKYFNSYMIASAMALGCASYGMWVNRCDPFGSFQEGLLGGIMVLIIGGVTVVMFFSWLLRWMSFEEDWRRRAIVSFSIFVPLTIGITTIILSANDVPFRAAFAWSRPAMERVANEMLTNGTKGFQPGTLGVLPVQSMKVEGNSVDVVLTGAVNRGLPVLQWNPSGNPPRFSPSRARPLGNEWYWVVY